MRIVQAVGAAALIALGTAAGWAQAADRPPNIVFLLADDLGYGEVGAFGQEKIRTPHIDQLAQEGMKLTQHYSGSNVCAPSRCVLLTGQHQGHAYIRDNRQAEGFSEGQTPVPPGELKLPLLFKKRGYVLGDFGKWGLGPVGSSGAPLKQGFDRFYGYNCQAKAHNYYPTHLWDNDEHVEIGNPDFSAHQKLPEDADPNDPASYQPYQGKVYAPDLINEKAREFVRENKDRPFFLYYSTTVPHVALQIPDDSLKEYAGQFEETPYKGDKGYAPQQQPRAAYAAMITRLDKEIGKLLDLLKELDLEDNTIVVFTSDNGATFDVGGVDTEFFNSVGGLRGRKGSYYEGGYRVPCIVRWPGHIAPGSVSDRVTGFEDWLPTLLELTGRKKPPVGIDGISFAPTLLGEQQKPRPFLYREAAGYGGQQAVRIGDWKGIRLNVNPRPKAPNQKPGKLELYNLADDPGETRDLAAEHPDIVAKILGIMKREHVPSELFPLRAIDGAGKEKG